MTNKVIILAAGIGSRLAPISTTIPKSLTRVAGREIIDYQVRGYLDAGIDEGDITVVAGYESQKLVDFFKQHYPQVEVIINTDYNSTNNMFSLYMALGVILKTKFDTLFINNADCIYDKNTIKNLLENPSENAIATEVGAYNEESMKITVNTAGSIVNIAKTIQQSDAYGLSTDLYKMSFPAADILYKITKDFIEVKHDLNQWTEVAFPELFTKTDFRPHDIKKDKWFEIDNLDDLQRADILFSDYSTKGKKAFIFDLDGTLMLGGEPIQPSIDWLNDHKTQFDYYFLTNNTSKPPTAYVEKLNKVGIATDESHITTPLFALSDYITKNNIKSAYLVANTLVTKYMKETHPDVSFSYNFDENEAIILTYDTEITYKKLQEVSTLLNNKSIDYIATHADIACPTELGGIPDIGSFIKLIESVTNKLPYIYFGKPDTNLIQQLIDKYGEKHLTIVGDRLYTDKKLADNANVDFICVLSGETSRIDLAIHDIGRYPALIVHDLSYLNI